MRHPGHPPAQPLDRAQLDELQRSGMLRPGLDLDWAALHTVPISLGTVVPKPGVSRQLGQPFPDARQVRRWKEVTTALFVEGELRR